MPFIQRGLAELWRKSQITKDFSISSNSICGRLIASFSSWNLSSPPGQHFRKMGTLAVETAVTANGSREVQKIKPENERSRFMEIYNQLKNELLSDSKTFQYTPESRVWVEKMLDHTIPGGKLNRGISVVDSLRSLLERELTEEEYFLSSALGWCIEWLQGYFLVEDDIMDGSVTRRGQPCWYRVPKVGLIAVNDGVVLRNHIPQILRRHFKKKPYYMELVDLFNEVEYQTSLGQMLDLITTPEGEVDLSKYIMPTYIKIVQYKTAYYSFYLPVACALLMVGEKDEAKFEAAEKILVQMGTYFQVQDDFLDCYGDPAFIGKIGTDIEDTKCSWLVVQALQRASEHQKNLIKENYGKKDPEKVAVIKKLYKELNIQKVFDDYEHESYVGLNAAIEKVDNLPLQGVFKAFLGKIYKRQK
uniref:Farnesyl pyrophosphate synthase n=1 Tax=Plagiochasma appendiculatum TaxID=157224 RepID=I6THC7_9MARC|nr:farnesyl pyrophosphate synthase [Plagiochasma appendiculatum]